GDRCLTRWLTPALKRLPVVVAAAEMQERSPVRQIDCEATQPGSFNDGDDLGWLARCVCMRFHDQLVDAREQIVRDLREGLALSAFDVNLDYLAPVGISAQDVRQGYRRHRHSPIAVP